LSGNLLLRESQFHIVNCLKSFDFKLFYVYTVVEGPFLARLHTRFALFCQTYGLLQSLNVALEQGCAIRCQRAQNHCQKVVNRGFTFCAGRLYVRAGGAWYSNL